MDIRLSRRSFLIGAGAATAGTVLAACKPETVVVEKEVTQVIRETVVVEGAPVEVEKIVEVTPVPLTGPTNALGVTLPADALPLEQQYRVVGTGEIGSGLAAWGAYGHSMESMYNHAYESGFGQEVLTSLDKEYNVIPIGCESFEMSEDGLYWDFHLRKNLVFSDGKPLVADDWVFTLRRSLGNGYDFGWFYYDILNAAEVTEGQMDPEELGIEAVDDYTLRIHTAAPTPHLPAIGVWFEVAPPQAYAQYGDTWSLEPEHYISSGPFTMAEFERGISYRWVLNTTYQGVLRPYFTEFRGEHLPSGLPAYIAGDVMEFSLNQDTPAGELAMVDSNPILRAESHPQPAKWTEYIGFNTLGGEFEPLNNRDVRLALCKAIDKESLVASIGRGFMSPAWGILPPGFPGYAGDQLKPLEPNVFDVEAARALLSNAGYPEGVGFPEFEFWIRAPEGSVLTMSQAIQAQWKDHLGVEVDLRPADYDAFTEKAFGEKTAAIYYVAYELDYYDPSTFLGVFRTAGGRHPHSDPEYDAFYSAGVSLLEPEKRAAQLVDAEKMLVESAAYFFLCSPFQTLLWPCNLSGWMMEPNADGYVMLGPPCAASWASVGLYWSNSDCRAGLK